MTLHFPHRPLVANLLFMENGFILSNIPSENSSKDWWLNTLSVREIISSLNATVNLTLEGHKSNGFLSFFLLFILSRAAAKFQFTNCKPYRFQRKGLEEQCSCGKGCTSAFPCIKVLITFTEYSSLVTHNISENIILHETETTLYREVRFA